MEEKTNPEEISESTGEQKPTYFNVLDAAKELRAHGLPIFGWKPGKCDYCGAGDSKKTRTLSNGTDMDARVPVRKMPGKGLHMKACTSCYKTRVECAYLGIYGRTAADLDA
jgi:hypothetical protein